MGTAKQAIDREEVARYRTQVQDNPESATHLRDAVEYFVEAGLLREAGEPLKKLIKLQPQDTSLLLLWGAVSVELGQIDQAEQAFIEVTRQDPQSTVGYHNLGILYFASGQPQRAEEQFAAILRREPDNREALNDLAVLYASTDRGARAQSTYERCLTLAPDYEKCWQNALDFAYSTGRFAVGAEWLSRLAPKNPEDVDLAGWREKFTRACREGTGNHSVPESLAQEKMSPDHGTVSVIIPVHNAEKLIADTIDSLLHQTYPNVEIIVVDDGSVDNTQAALDAYGEKITYVSRVHEGWAAAANDGIQRSRGQWILAVNPGDVLKPRAIEKQIGFLIAHPTCDVVFPSEASRVPHDPQRGPAGGGSSNGEGFAPTMPLLGRRAFARTGFFDETAGDDDGAWARCLMTAKVQQLCNIGRLDQPLFSRWARQDLSVGDDQYRLRIIRRWVAEIQRPGEGSTASACPAVKTKKRTGLSLLLIGADDPGGMFSSLARAVNEYTPHRCRVLAHKTSGAYDSRVLLKLPEKPEDAADIEAQTRRLAEKADLLIFAAGIAPGAARRDRPLEDTDEIPFGALDWRAYSSQKKCAAFLCGSPSVRGNYRWYHRRFAERGWPVMTAAPDIYLNVPDAHFVPPVLNLSLAEYTRPNYDVGPVVVVYHERPGYAAGGEDMLGPVARRLKEKYGQQVLFGRCVEMTLQQTLLFRHKAHIGFDRLSFGAPRFGLTSLENSALGLVNIVYLDPFARALLARTLGTDELPWLSPDSVDALHEMIAQLIGSPDNLREQMRKTAEWFHRWWSEDRLIQRLTTVLEEI